MFIIKASYGDSNHRVDVTDEVRTTATSNNLNLPPRWAFGRVDPAAGTVKTVEIAYLYAHALHIATFKQIEEIKLPPSTAVKENQEYGSSFTN